MSVKSSLKKAWHSSRLVRPAFWALYRKVNAFNHKNPIGRIYFERRKDRLYNKYFPSLYNARRKEQVDPKKVIFLECVQPKLTENVLLIYDRLEKSGQYTIHRHFLRTNFVYRRQWIRNCTDFLTDLATAKYVFLTEASDVLSSVDLRPETVVCQTWHGCGAFKRFGLSTADYKFGSSRDEMLKHPLYKNYTYVTVSSPEVAWAYVEAMHLQGHEDVVQPVGVSRTDVFFDPEKIRKAYETVYAKFPAARGKKIILYAPTFRGFTASAEAPDKLDVRAFYKALGEDYVLIIKHHQLVRQLPKVPEELKGKFVCDGSRDMDIGDLLMVSDICISDYSSLIFEYSLMERPMLFFAYDLEDYFDWRGFYYPYDEMTPGPVCRTNEELIDYIRHVEERFDRKKVRDFRDRFMRSCDGRSTDRILRMVFGKDIG